MANNIYKLDVPSKQEQLNNMKKSTAKYLKDNPGSKIPREFKDTMPKENTTNRMNRLISGPDKKSTRA